MSTRKRKKESDKYNITFNMELSGVSETREILIKKDNYTFQKFMINDWQIITMNYGEHWKMVVQL